MENGRKVLGAIIMTVSALFFTSLFLGIPNYKVIDKMRLLPGQELQINSSIDTLVSHDSSIVIKTGETKESAVGGDIIIGKYQSEGKNISSWIFIRYESDRLFLTGTYTDGKSGIIYSPADLPHKYINIVAIKKPISESVSVVKPKLNERLVMAALMIGGGTIVGAVAGTFYVQKKFNGYQGQEIGGMVAGMGLGFLISSVLYLQIIHDF